MKRVAFIVAASLLAATVLGQSADEKRRADRQARIVRQERLWKLESRAREIKPQRRDSPLRDLNITDNEVRQIEAVTSGVFPKAILNISGVVTGCPCEEGPTCSDQVWVSTNQDGNTIGVQLSKIDNRWKIGAVQTWWIEYERLMKRRDQFVDWREYDAALKGFVEKFPACRIG